MDYETVFKKKKAKVKHSRFSFQIVTGSILWDQGICSPQKILL